MSESSTVAPEATDWLTLSPKAEELERVLLERSTGRVRTLLKRLFRDPAVHALQSYANTVSIRRLGFNDHGTVHMRITTHCALKILKHLDQGGVKTSLVAEEIGTFEDSQVAVVLGCFMHDLGMGVTRRNHEWHSLTFADEFIVRYLGELYPDDLAKRCALRALCHEIIVGHMANDRIHSIEAGTVLVADGTDMTRGRSRIPQMLERDPMVGDIHRHSASSITRVEVGAGEGKPVRVGVHMEDFSGVFQVEEVFMTKVKASPIMRHLEVVVFVKGQEPRFYLR
ncbi:phosphohydrolase [Candidatus Sumerlaeota bacterium]|nr:phosphohydrolase [Candidatus Sumerlaeota bacterium]